MKLNENRRLLLPVLETIRTARRAYGDAVRDRDLSLCQDCAVKLGDQLGNSAVQRAIDEGMPTALRQHGTFARIDAKLLDRFIAVELELCQKFGFSRREAESYIQAAVEGRQSPAALALRVHRAADLVSEAEALNERVQKGVETCRNASWFKRRSCAKRLVAEVDARLYAIGTIIADGCHAPSFPFSYWLATCTVTEG